MTFLESEGRRSIENPTEEDVREMILALGGGKTTFGSLTDQDGNYVQVAGGRPWVMVEWRQIEPLLHQRANAKSVRQPYSDGGSIRFTAGPVTLRADEWLLQKQAIEIFLAFLRDEPFPQSFQWRSINAVLGITE